MTTNKITIKPGFLVSLKSSVKGGIQYIHDDVAPKSRRAAIAPDGAQVTAWKTTKIVDDPEEFERATKARNAALAKIRAVCRHTAFGLLCPESAEPELDAAVVEAKAIVDAYNATATCTRVEIWHLKGRIASNEEEVVKAIGGEVRDLLDEMNTAVEKMDPKAIREAATKLRQMEAMLGAEQAEKASLAVEQARKAARMIVARVEKGGEAAEKVFEDIAVGHIKKARMAFLDLEEPKPVEGAAMPATNMQRFAGLDLSGTEG